MAAQLFDCTVPLKVFSFRDNTDYGRIPWVNEAPFQRVTHFRSLLCFNQAKVYQAFSKRIPGWVLI